MDNGNEPHQDQLKQLQHQQQQHQLLQNQQREYNNYQNQNLLRQQQQHHQQQLLQQHHDHMIRYPHHSDNHNQSQRSHNHHNHAQQNHHHQQQQQKQDQQQQSPHHHQLQHHHDHRKPHHHNHKDHKTKLSTKRHTVLVAMDGAPHSFFAFEWYMANLHKPGNDVIVAHSSQPSSLLLSRTEPLLPSVLDSAPSACAVASREEEQVNAIAQQIKGTLTATGMRGRLVRVEGDPGPAIIQLANESNVDVIVTGSRGMGTIKRALIGSVSDYVLHHATCPVLVCRHHKEKREKT